MRSCVQPSGDMTLALTGHHSFQPDEECAHEIGRVMHGV